MGGTDADVHFINDWTHPVTVTRTSQTAMSDEYPETHEVAALTSSDMHYVSASVAPWKFFTQSQFNLGFAGSTTTLYIGQGLQKTAVQSVSGPDYETGIVLAPANPGSMGTDYNFFILSGPNLLAPLLNSYIQANLAWFCESLKSEPRTKTFGSLNLVVSALKPETLACTYATCVPAGNPIWKFNVIITFSGAIGGSLSWGDISNPTQLGAFEAKVTGLSALIQATLDFSDLSAPSFVFDTFQISLMGWHITESPLLNLITGPLLRMGHEASNMNILMTAYRFAGLINSNTLGPSSTPTNCNKIILQSINDMLAQELARIPKGAFPRALPLPKHIKQATQAIRDRWMSDPGLQAKKLRQIVLPATHDSQAYFLSDTLSQVPYSDIAFLWKLRPGTRPVDDDSLRKERKERKKREEHIFLGAALHAYVIRRVQFVARAQDREVLVQLSQGIRVFDLRIYHDSRDGEIWTQHCLRARQLRDIFSQVRHFLDQHHDSRELVFLGLSHLRRPDDVPHAAQVAQLAKDILGAYIYMPDGAEGEVNFDFSMLADLPLSQIVGIGPKVILLNGDHDAQGDIYYTHSILNTSGFDPNGAVSLSQGCSATDMLFNILDAVSLNEQLLLQLTAAVANAKVKAKLAECPDANLVSLDWHEYYEDGSEPAVDVILRRNGVNTSAGWDSEGLETAQTTATHSIPAWNVADHDEVTPSLTLAELVKTVPGETFVVFNAKRHNMYLGSDPARNGVVVGVEVASSRWTIKESTSDATTCTIQLNHGKYLAVNSSAEEGSPIVTSDSAFAWLLSPDGEYLKFGVPGTKLFVSLAADGSSVFLRPQGDDREQSWYCEHVYP